MSTFAFMNWWTDGDRRIAFGRGADGFVVVNASTSEMRATLQTALPPGAYRDILGGGAVTVKAGGAIEVGRR